MRPEKKYKFLYKNIKRSKSLDKSFINYWFLIGAHPLPIKNLLETIKKKQLNG